VRLFAIQRVVGAGLGLSAVLNVVPWLISISIHDGAANAFAESFLIVAGLGFVLWWPVRGVRTDLRLRDGFLVVSALWLLMSLTAAVPFVLGPPRLDFAQAVFEATSGLTTTGATVIAPRIVDGASVGGIDALPPSVHFYRQSLCFLGGMGIVILAVAILPMLRIGGMQLFRAEAAGPNKDKLTPRVKDTAKLLWMVYLGLNVVCTLAYWLAGMSLFDAVCHAFSTVATAGFSTHDASIAHYNSELIEWIAIVFMFIGGVNFGLHFAAWRRASSTPYRQDTELKLYLRIVLVMGFACTLVLFFAGTEGKASDALRNAFFHVVSNITTTGFTTTGFAHWPGALPVLLIAIAFIGACAGSTSGGMKTIRVLIILRQSFREILRLIHPKGQFNVKVGGISVPENVMDSVWAFATLFILSFIGLALAMASTGVDYVTAFSAAGTTLTNLGPGLGGVVMSFSEMNDGVLWLGSFGMILGRLEVFTLLVIFSPAFWRE
jgi:trk system potassium uptake protein TrkH